MRDSSDWRWASLEEARTLVHEYVDEDDPELLSWLAGVECFPVSQGDEDDPSDEGYED